MTAREDLPNESRPLAAIRARVEAATQPTDGETWTFEKSAGRWEVFTGPLSVQSQDIAVGIFHRTDAEFIAHARTDVPALLTLVDKLASALDRTERNFILAVNGKPVRDMCENLAENRAALTALSSVQA